MQHQKRQCCTVISYIAEENRPINLIRLYLGGPQMLSHTTVISVDINRVERMIPVELMPVRV